MGPGAGFRGALKRGRRVALDRATALAGGMPVALDRGNHSWRTYVGWLAQSSIGFQPVFGASGTH